MSSKRREFWTKENFTYGLILILILFLILYFYRLGSVGLIDVDEPRYAEAGREMLESGNWIVPYFNYEVRYDKPILFYWLEAVSMKLFGVNEFAARFPSVAMSLLCLSMLFVLIKNIFNFEVALVGVLILISCFEFVALSRFSVTDMTLSAFISSSFCSFYLGYNNIINSHKLLHMQVKEFSCWYILGFIFLALAFLTKGPVSIILFLLVLVPFFLWIGKLEYFYKNISFWIGTVIFFLIIAPWYISVHCATGGDFTKVFFGLHNFSRYTSVVSGHRGSIFYFIPVVLIGFLPWIFFLPQAISSMFKEGMEKMQASPKEQLPWFALWWF